MAAQEYPDEQRVAIELKLVLDSLMVPCHLRVSLLLSASRNIDGLTASSLRRERDAV